MATIEQLSQALSEIGSGIQVVNNHANDIQQQSSTQAHVADSIRTKVETITSHADDTSTHALQSREISVNLEQLAEQLEQLLHQFTLSSDNNA